MSSSSKEASRDVEQDRQQRMRARPLTDGAPDNTIQHLEPEGTQAKTWPHKKDRCNHKFTGLGCRQKFATRARPQKIFRDNVADCAGTKEACTARSVSKALGAELVLGGPEGRGRV